MILKIDNIGAASINGTVYGWHYFDLRCKYGRVRSTSALRLLTPDRGEVAGRVLDIDGPVWIDAAILTGFDTFAQGGYLETITRPITYAIGNYDYNSGSWTYTDSDTISLSYLGLRPAAYTGGLKIGNLDTPVANNWTNIVTNFGYRKYCRAASFLLNSRTYYIWNHQTDYYEPISGTWYRAANIYPGMVCTGLTATPGDYA